MINKIQYAVKDPLGLLRKWTHRSLKPFGHRDYTRYIILARARTGSNLLVSYLKSHPNLHAESLELFGKLNDRDYKQILDQVFSKQPFYIRAAGFKIMYNHPVDDKNSDLWFDLARTKDLHVIHLKRRNILRSIISGRIAKDQGVWYSTGGRPKEPVRKKVNYTKDELEDLFIQTQEWQNKGDQMFHDHPLLNIYYEDLTQNLETEFSRITDFLGVKRIKPKTILKKQNPEKLSSLIENYDELKNDFTGTEWYSYFED